MGSFNFEIDPGAKFIYGADRQSTRDLLKFTQAKRRWQATAPNATTIAAGSGRPVPPLKLVSHSARSHATQQAAVHRGPIESKLSNYRNFKISTLRQSESAWVAYFERSDGHPFLLNGNMRSMAKTPSCGSEFLAITDARVSIDDLIAAEPAGLPGR